jgi:hypothetical protein
MACLIHPRLTGYRDFTDGARRPVDEDAEGKYVLGDDGERIAPPL